jgi:hypothetical protein
LLVLIIYAALPNFNSFMISLVMLGVMVAGGFFYWIGGCMLAAEINKAKGDDSSSFAGVVFGEATLIFLYAVLIGLDAWRCMLGPEGRRLLAHLVVLAFCSMVLFFSYGTFENPEEYTQAIAAGYFFVFIGTVLVLVFRLLLGKIDVVQRWMFVIDWINVFIILLGAFICACGYWATADEIVGSSDFAKQVRGYFFALGYFVFAYSFLVCIDVALGDLLLKIPGCDRCGSERVAKSRRPTSEGPQSDNNDMNANEQPTGP